MKAISIREPWATLIMHHGKTTENRGWWTKYRGPLAICASRQVEDVGDWSEFVDYIRDEAEEQGRAVTLPDKRPIFRPGFCLGFITLFAVDRLMLSVWDEPGQFHFRLVNPVLLDPFPVTGQLGLFDLDMPKVPGG